MCSIFCFYYQIWAGSLNLPWSIGKPGDAGSLPQVRSDMGFLAFSFPWSLGSGVYDEINGGQQKLVRTYLSYISTKFQLIWISFGVRVSKTNPNWLKFGRDIAQISVHQFLLSINFVINSTPQGPWECKGQKTHVTPYSRCSVYAGLPRCMRYFLLLVTQVGQFPELTLVCRQAT